MAISSTPAVGTGSPSQSSNIGIQDFLKILTSQLNNQDPLKPVDNQEFVAQIAQFATLEQSRQLNVKIDDLLTVQSSVQSVGLLGKTVDVNQNGFIVSGRVTALDVSRGSPMLTVTTATGAFQNNISPSQLLNIRP
ncbi:MULTISPECIES: flagellar hook assembly protein FlgD [unclassified Duganella]|uniref:flagellar hook assembly protein FlgD n=1 Tax=unclassified Duganella TaxID=2636909 RepID=UPI00087383BB|nr:MULTISPECIES: flagellar hook capping FlgD N-terminal domain-containing protein [unclassified Duganella]OEZ52845.1 flagellar basal body rod modification protein [Duganella sp. HH105]OFA06674.1 flagellar basal body rod modification protein [Duganella sp. HH101]